MDDTDQGPVRQEVQGTVLVMTLNNPPVNALGYRVRAALSAGLDRAVQDVEITDRKSVV